MCVCVGWASGDVHRQVKSLRVTGGRERQQTNKQTNGQTHTERERERERELKENVQLQQQM